MTKTGRSFFHLFASQLFLVLALTVPLTALAEDFNFPGLSGTVTVTEDQYGIPTIKGQSELDVIFVQGYLHARDRFFQMDRDRKLAAGRGAELLGEAALSSDIELRAIGFHRAALMTWQKLDAETRGYLQAYCNGVNTWLANNPLPPEHAALEITKTDPWTPLDTLIFAKATAASLSLETDDIDNTITLGAYTAVGEIAGFNGAALFFEDTHRSAPPDNRVTAPDFLSQPDTGTQSLESTGAARKPASVPTVDAEVSDQVLSLARDLRSKLDNAPMVERFLQNPLNPNGSNAWLIAGDHTESGNPMIANDPHLSLEAPALLYEINMIYDTEDGPWAVRGLNFPGFPGALLGCNTEVCWGLTVNNLDVTDIFTESFQTNAIGLPTHTLYKGNPEPIRQVFNSFFVNVIGDEVPDNLVRANVGYTSGALTLIVPRHNDAPVLNIDGTDGLSLAYSGSRDTHEMAMIRKLNNASNLDEFQDALQYWDIGNQAIYYADRSGNIAWFTTSEKPLREDLANFTIDGLPPWFIRDGTGAAMNEWLPVSNPQPQQALDFEILPFDEMPQLINPPTGYVAYGNNDPVGTTLDNVPYNEVRPSGLGLYYLNYRYYSYRMGRIDREIQSMLASGNPITMEDSKALQANVEMLDAELILPTLLNIMSQVPVPPDSPMAQALDVLSTWDYTGPTGITEGWDAGDDPMLASEPDLQERRSAAAATVWAMWRSMLVQNTINATLTAYGLGDYLPPSRWAYIAFKHHLENYPTNGGIGASGINFFSLGLAETVAGSLQMALEKLASDEFAPAFANSTDVMDYAWGKLHRVKFRHILNTDPFNVPNGGNFLDLAPDLPGLSRQGGYDVVDASAHSSTADGLNEFMFSGGPVRRFIADMAPEGIHAEQVIPGGQSGVFYSPNYFNQLPLWLTNSYRSMVVGEQGSNTPAAAANSAEESTND